MSLIDYEHCDKDKLPVLLELKCYSISDVAEELGRIAQIKDTLIAFQMYLYEKRVA